jgi:predicted secreted protein
MDKKIIACGILALALVTSPAVWAKKKLGPEAVWEPGATRLQALRDECAAGDPAKLKSCWIAAMKKGGASKEAVDFASQLQDPGCLRDYKEGGAAGIAYVVYPYRANENNAVYLVNGKPDLIDVDNQSQLPTGEMQKDPVYTDIAKKYPNVTLWPGDRFTAGHPSAQLLAGGGVRFLVDYRLLDGCHACEELGTAYFAFEFEPDGKLKGVTFSRVDDAKRTQKKIEVTSGQEFNIRLKANRTTGFRWLVIQPPSESVVKFAWKLYNEPDAQMPGAPGEEVWGFKAVAPGTTSMQLAYVQPFEKDAPPAQEALYHIVVK